MSVITSYTITCDKRPREGEAPCAEQTGPYPTVMGAQAAAEAAGWRIDYRLGPFPEGDRCPAHIAPLDRVSWE